MKIFPWTTSSFRWRLMDFLAYHAEAKVDNSNDLVEKENPNFMEPSSWASASQAEKLPSTVLFAFLTMPCLLFLLPSFQRTTLEEIKNLLNHRDDLVCETEYPLYPHVLRPRASLACKWWLAGLEACWEMFISCSTLYFSGYLQRGEVGEDGTNFSRSNFYWEVKNYFLWTFLTSKLFFSIKSRNYNFIKFPNLKIKFSNLKIKFSNLKINVSNQATASKFLKMMSSAFENTGDFP